MRTSCEVCVYAAREHVLIRAAAIEHSYGGRSQAVVRARAELNVMTRIASLYLSLAIFVHHPLQHALTILWSAEDTPTHFIV